MYELNMYRLGRRIAAKRVLADWTQKDLADRAGTTQAAIARIEKGKRPQVSVGTLYAIARALGASLDELVGMGEEDAEERTQRVAVAH